MCSLVKRSAIFSGPGIWNNGMSVDSPVVQSMNLLIVATLLKTNIRNFLFTLWHQLIAIVESVKYSTSDTIVPRAFFTKKPSSVISRIADSSFLGMLMSIILLLAVSNWQL